MEFNKLNLTVVQSTKGNLFLQTNFYVPRIDYRGAGFKIKPTKKTGITTVEVYIRKEETLPGIDQLVCFNPIVHWIDLGKDFIVSKDGKINSKIKVTMYELSASAAKNGDDKKTKIESETTDSTSKDGETP